MLEAVYAHARAQGAVQVTVEDAHPQRRSLQPACNPMPPTCHPACNPHVTQPACFEHLMQVTVEDANPEFRMLRDLTDVRNCKRRGLLTPASCDQAPPKGQP